MLPRMLQKLLETSFAHQDHSCSRLGDISSPTMTIFHTHFIGFIAFIKTQFLLHDASYLIVSFLDIFSS